MSHEDHELSRLLGELRDGPVLLSAQPELEARRGRLLPELRARVRGVPERARRQRRLRVLFTGMALAAATVLGVSFVWRASSQLQPLVLAPLVLAPGQAQPLASSATFTQGTSAPVSLGTAVRVEPRGELAVSSRSSLTTPEGVEVQLAEQTRVGLDLLVPQDKTSELRLLAGSVSCHVPHLGSAGSFAVVTANTRVIVHGTRFSVDVRGKDETRACVRVTDGLVEVRNGSERVMLGAGKQWGCADDSVADHESPRGAPVSAEGEARQPSAQLEQKRRDARERLPLDRAGADRSGGDRSDAERSPASGTLAAENQLMSQALSAERRGDLDRARQLYAKFVSEYPASVFVPEARAGLSRLE